MRVWSTAGLTRPDRHRPRGWTISSELDELAPAIDRAYERRAFDFQVWGREWIGMIEPIWLLKYLPNMLACHISILLDCQGPSNTITEAEASAEPRDRRGGADHRAGRAEVMITGGADSKIHPLSSSGWACSIRCRTRRDRPALPAVRPPAPRLGARRKGGILILEERDHALRQSARIHGEVLGGGSGCDARRAAGSIPTVSAPMLPSRGPR